MTKSSASTLVRNVEVVERQIHPLRLAIKTDEGEEYTFGQFEADITDLSESEKVILSEALFDEQVLSKLWLLDHLFDLEPFERADILVLGGWCGVLPWLAHLTGRGTNTIWKSIDFDAGVGSIGRRAFGRHVPNVSFVYCDIYDLDYHQLARKQPLVVINTICEHLAAFDAWRSMLPAGVLTVLQSNNYRGCPDHVNCVDSTMELVAKARFSEVLFVDSLPLSLFTRFMVIGRT
jgi:hypothetical protein